MQDGKNSDGPVELLYCTFAILFDITLSMKYAIFEIAILFYFGKQSDVLWHVLAQKHFAVLQALALGESAIDWTPETDDHTLPDLAGMERSRVCADASRSLYLCLGVRPFSGIYSSGRCETFDPSSEIRSRYFSVFHLDCTKIRVFIPQLPINLHRHVLHRHVFIPGIHLS
jgi:hypothetical protein